MPKTASVSLESIETDFSTELIEIELPGGTRGLQGEQGIQGEIGETPQFHVGSVTKGDDPEVSVTGTRKDPVLNMVLPKGDKGDIGLTPQLEVGTVTKGEEPEVTITGTDENPIINMVLPKGDKGDIGHSGVWVGDTTPTADDYTVWIDPENTPGTIPTKVSELQNDSGYITSSSLPTKTSDLNNDSGYITTNDIPKDVYSFQETLTNKVYIDENNVEYPVYRKMMWVDFSAFDSQGHYEHGIENLGGVLTQKWLYENITTTETYRSADPYYIGDYYKRMLSVFSITDEYFEIYEYEPSNFSLLLLLEYTKTS